MSRIQELFRSKANNILSVYTTAGYPGLNSTMPLMETLQDSGVDMIELGMPYSDPLADGPVIQHSSSLALSNGMTLSVLFGQLKELRPRIRIPVILMGYMNPVLQYGFEEFCEQASRAGIDGLILPDLPEYEYDSEYSPIIRKHGLDFIFLVTPETSEERVRRLDALSSGFLYAVSSSSTTGSEKNMGGVQAYLGRLKSYGLKNPVMVGFGIRDKASFEAACAVANGAIIGTAFIRALENGGDEKAASATFINKVLGKQ